MADRSVATSRRVRLDQGEVVTAAEEIVDRVGWDGLTMTVLAGELGIKVPSLYSHVRSLDAVRGSIQVRTMEALGAELRTAAMGQSGAAGVAHLAAVYRAFVRSWPRRYEGTTREPIDRDAFLAASLDANDALRAMLRSLDLDGEDLLYAEIAVFAALHGFATLEASRFFGDVFDADRVFALVLEGALAPLTTPTLSATFPSEPRLPA